MHLGASLSFYRHFSIYIYLYVDYPAVVRACVEGMHDGSSELLLRALGGCVWQLKRVRQLHSYSTTSIIEYFFPHAYAYKRL